MDSLSLIDVNCLGLVSLDDPAVGIWLWDQIPGHRSNRMLIYADGYVASRVCPETVRHDDNSTMPSRPNKPKDHDFATVAHRVVERAIGEKLDGTPAAAEPNRSDQPDRANTRISQ